MVVATALTDAVYVMFTSSVIARRRVAAAIWSSLWYTALLVCGDQLHQQLGVRGLRRRRLVDRRLRTMTYLHGPPSHPPAPLKPSPDARN